MESHQAMLGGLLNPDMQDGFASDFRGIGSGIEPQELSPLELYGATFPASFPDQSTIYPELLAPEFSVSNISAFSADFQSPQQFELPYYGQQELLQPAVPLEQQFSQIQITVDQAHQSFRATPVAPALELSSDRHVAKPELHLRTIELDTSMDYWGRKLTRKPTWAQIADIGYNPSLMYPIHTNPTVNPQYLSPNSATVSPVIPPVNSPAMRRGRSRLSLSSATTHVRRTVEPIVMSMHNKRQIVPTPARSRRERSPGARSTTSRRSTISKSAHSRRTSVTSRSQSSPMHRCEECGRQCKTRELLSIHEQTHNPDYVCKACTRSFKDAIALKGHMKIHAPHNHACDECVFTCTWRKDLDRHMKKHTKEKDFKCTCGGVFSRKDNLQRHLRDTGHSDPEAAESVVGFVVPP